MRPIDGQPILTAAKMRAAEERAIAAGSSVTELMERAGAGVAEAVRRLASGAEVLMLCGPGNNGGDGYVAARILRANGIAVRVAATGEPRTEAAALARQSWGGAVDPLADAGSAPIMVDALFGTGLSRPLDGAVRRALFEASAARLKIAVDLPSGVDTDTGALLGVSDMVELPLSGGQLTMRGAPSSYDVTLALGAVKPAHVLYPSAGVCGTVRLLDIGVDPDADDLVIKRPYLSAPDAAAQKYSRGMVAVVAGAMPGAAALCTEAALRAGAGYALLITDEPSATPHAIVRRRWSANILDDRRIGVVVIGPGLGRDDVAREKLDVAIAAQHDLLIDGDALHLLEDHHFEQFQNRERHVVLTPHAGEFRALFGDWSGSKIEAARRAAARSGAWVVFKGPDTVIAMPNRRGPGDILVSSGANAWLSTAGTGDVLAGTIAATLGGGGASIFSIGAGVWIHAEAARRLGASFIADDLVRELTAVRGSL